MAEIWEFLEDTNLKPFTLKSNGSQLRVFRKIVLPGINF